MKVLVISHMYPSPFNEVFGIFVHEQVKELVKQGCAVKVVSPVPWSPFPINRMSAKWKAYSEISNREIRDGIEVFYLKYLLFPRAQLLGYGGEFKYWGVKKLINNLYNTFQFDLIHAHMAFPDGFICLSLKMKYQIPLVVTIHGLDVYAAPHKPLIERGKMLKGFIMQVFKNADKIVCVSSKVRDIITKYYHNHNKVIFVNNGIPLEKTRCNYLKKYDRRVRIISVGNLIKRKGHEFVIRSLPSLIQEGVKLEYTIVGDGENREFLENLTKKLRAEETVSFLGAKNQDDVYQYLASSDIFCLPSWSEAFGVVYLEAMAMGLPVIACRGEGIEDVIDNGINGMLVEQKDTVSVREALKKLIMDPYLCKEMGDRAKKKVCDNFTWEKNVNKYIEIYKDVLNRRRNK